MGLSGKVQMPSRLRLGQDHHVEQESALIRFKFTPNCATEAPPADVISDSQPPLVKIADIYRRQRARRQTYIRFCAKGCAKDVRESTRSIAVTTRSDNHILWSANGSTAK